MRACLPFVLFAIFGFCHLSFAQKTPLGEAVKDIDVAPHWIYDNWPKAVAEAKATGKPIMVVVRCVPCPPGRTLDEQVMNPTGELEKLEREFVCVRLIQTNGLDLATFQYDFDMSWSSLFLNADLMIYGRYGSRASSGPGSDAILSVKAFTRAAERALALHKNYPANKAALAAKTGPAPEYATPEKTPGLTDKGSSATTRQNCIHCHMVKEYALRAKWEAGKLSAKDLYVFPMPAQIGLTMELDDDLKVKQVAEGSPAAAVGIAAGDSLLTFGGQPLVSQADVQWVLNAAPATADLPVTFRRGEKTLEKTLKLSGNWKEYDLGWRASSWYGLRQGVKFEPLPAADRASRGLKDGELALVVKGLFGKGGPKVAAAGLKTGDVIVAVDGKTTAMSESEFLVNLRLKYGPQDSVKLTVLRGQERQDFTVPLW